MIKKKYPLKSSQFQNWERPTMSLLSISHIKHKLCTLSGEQPSCCLQSSKEQESRRAYIYVPYAEISCFERCCQVLHITDESMTLCLSVYPKYYVCYICMWFGQQKRGVLFVFTLIGLNALFGRAGRIVGCLFGSENAGVLYMYGARWGVRLIGRQWIVCVASLNSMKNANVSCCLTSVYSSSDYVYGGLI